MGEIRHRAAPRRLGSYEVLREIGQGGMGVVYLARQPSLERYVVLKKIRRDLLADASMVKRFQLEARAAAAIQHQNVVAVHDCFSYRGDQYITQELVDGKNVQSALTSIGRVDPGVAMIVALEIARGLEEIHAKGIVHRDLKPANILIGRNGEIKIADFGIALGLGSGGLTRPGTMLGSLPYMSPEQMLGRRVDARSDLFSFGVLFYEILTGTPPFSAPSGDSLEPLLEAMQDSRYEPVRKRGVAAPASIERLIRSCLQFKPARRLQSAGDLRQHLERRLGALSPNECRAAIAAYFREKRVLRPPRGRRANRTEVESNPKRPRSLVRASIVLFAAVLLSGAIALPRLLREPEPEPRLSESSSPGISGPDSPTVASAAPASIRFVAYPWAEVHLSDGASFYTPRAEAVALQPGLHKVVFVHPSFGRQEYDLDLAPGEQRVVRHAYEGAPQP